MRIVVWIAEMSDVFRTIANYMDNNARQFLQALF